MRSGYRNTQGLTLRRFRNNRSKPEILIAPLIDIVFLLLIFFMLVTRFLSPSVAIALPESDTGNVNESRSVTVSIDIVGNIFLGEDNVSLDQIPEKLNSLRLEGEIEIVRLRADRATDWQYVVDVMDAIREAGIIDIAIETVREEDTE